jgi:FMN phosphatase YigB (HAD superfamily)/ribulose-5-phosphate 4-epimerase/fuculose-1-phosphate aldolase
MFYKGIIFDLDNTLYDYDFCHDKALQKVFNYIVQVNQSLNIEYVTCEYEHISKKLKNELGCTASSHNKSIYFKQLLEELNIDLSLFFTINSIYWEIFYESMICFEGVIDFLAFNKRLGKKIGILTDYETEYQLTKLSKLGILKYIDIIVTSEEIGIEKPSSKMFNHILHKLQFNSSEVIVIGDNFEKDIQGAIHMNILAYWFNRKKADIFCDNYFIFHSFESLHIAFNTMHSELISFKNISKYCGERFDLVQAGGGNISVKINEFMFIKASGYNLTNIDETNGYTVINNKILLEDIHKNITKDVTEYNFVGKKRGSIETFMHSILKKYTVHVHPIQINRILVSKKAVEIINEIYPNSLIIEYLTPGIKVCNKIKETYNNENIIFLLNHGIIITSNDISEIYTLINDVLIKFEEYQSLNFNAYKHTNFISKTINELFHIDNISYLCQDEVINHFLHNKKKLWKENVTFPDFLIYCGVQVLFDLHYIEEYKNTYHEPPKIIIDNDLIYINSHSLTKCKEIEDVLKSNLLILDSSIEKKYLSPDEIYFLNNWDAEKYRLRL